jgi:hypothetical protein
VSADAARHLKARVTVVAISESDWQLELTTELGGIKGERVLRGRSCQAVADAATLTLALILNPEFQQTGEQPAAEKPAAASPIPRVTASPPEPPPPAQRLPERVRGLALSQIGFASGTLPRLTAELTLGLGAALGPASGWVLASYDPPQEPRVQGQNAGARLWAGSAALLGCWAFNARSPIVGSCLGAEFRRLEGRGTGVTHPRTNDIYWVAPALGITGDLRLASRVQLRVAAFGNAPLHRPSVFLDGLGEVYRPERVGGRILGGVVVDWK